MDVDLIFPDGQSRLCSLSMISPGTNLDASLDTTPNLIQYNNPLDTAPNLDIVTNMALGIDPTNLRSSSESDIS